MRGPSSTSSHGCFFPEPPICSTRSASQACLQEPGQDGRHSAVSGKQGIRSILDLQRISWTHGDGLRKVGYKESRT